MQPHEGIQCFIHTEDIRTSADFRSAASLGDFLLRLEVLPYPTPVALLELEPVGEVFFRSWAILNLQLFRGRGYGLWPSGKVELVAPD